MTKKLSLLTIVLFLNVTINNSYSQQNLNGWYWLNGRPQSNSLNWVKIFNSGVIYAVGSNGTFMISDDGGNFWTINSQAGPVDNSTFGGGNTRNIASAYFFDENTGVTGGASLSGNGDAISRTIDGGQTFTHISLGTSAYSITGFYYDAGANALYACGNAVTRLWKSIDQGATWTAVPNVPASLTYNSVYADGSNIFLTTSIRRIVKTNDGGSTWNTQTLPGSVSNTLTDIGFQNANIGYVTGNANYFAYTLDGGLSWTQSNPPATEGQRKLKIVGTDVFTAGSSNEIFKSADNGVSWITINFHDATNPNQPDPSIIYGMDINGSKITVTGANGIFNMSNTSGTSWSNKNYSVPSDNFMSDIWIDSPQGKIWAGGVTGKMIYSEDGGQNWIEQTTGLSNRINEIQMLNGNVGFAVSGSTQLGGGILIKTIDGGNTWTPIPLGAPHSNYNTAALEFLDENTGWVWGGLPQIAGGGITLLKTVNGGFSWTQQPNDISFNEILVDGDMADANTGYCIAGPQRHVFKTIDGGNSWIKLLATPGSGSVSYNKIQALTSSIVFVSGSNGLLSKSFDGGAIWTDILIPNSGNVGFFSMDWYDENNGVICGTSGFMAKTKDGGVTWTANNAGGSTLVNIRFGDMNTVYAVSDRNVINQVFKYYDPLVTSNVIVNPGSASFPTLKDAFSAINTNTGGFYTNQNVTVSIVNSTTETSPAVLNGSIFTSCVIRPANNSITVTAASGVQELIVLDGADNVTIDGRVGGTGLPQLSIINTDPGVSRTCIKMINGASNNTVQYLTSLCDGVSADANNIYIASTEVNLATTGNDDNKIENCVIEGGYRGVYVTANPIPNQGSKINSGSLILNNEVKNFKLSGINTGNNTKSNRIEGNKVIFGSAAYVAGEIYLYGITCNGVGENHIERNKISSTINSVPNTYYFGISLGPMHTQQGGNSSTNYVFNNFVSLIDDAAGYMYGIYSICFPSFGQIIQNTNISHNTVYIGKSGAVTSGFSVGFGLYNLTVPGSVYGVYNNLLINERGNSPNPQGQWALEIQPNPIVTLNADYNCYWSYSNFAIWNSVNYAGLSAYQTAASPNEQNTILKTAEFADKLAGDLHLSGASISDYDLIGKRGTGVATDFDLDSRSPLYPYKGADESTSLSNAGGATTLNLKCYVEGFYKSTSNLMSKSIPAEVSLRRSVAPFNLISSVSATLDVNGDANSLNFNIPYPGTYYIIVKNWNMISTWNAVPQSFTVGGTTSYDFSTAVNQAYGDNMSQVDDSPFIRWGTYVGDVNQDGIVDNSDLTNIHSASSAYSTGNVVTDITGDEIIDVDDLYLVKNNQLNAITVLKP